MLNFEIVALGKVIGKVVIGDEGLIGVGGKAGCELLVEGLQLGDVGSGIGGVGIFHLLGRRRSAHLEYFRLVEWPF